MADFDSSGEYTGYGYSPTPPPPAPPAPSTRRGGQTPAPVQSAPPAVDPDLALAESGFQGSNINQNIQQRLADQAEVDANDAVQVALDTGNQDAIDSATKAVNVVNKIKSGEITATQQNGKIVADTTGQDEDVKAAVNNIVDNVTKSGNMVATVKTIDGKLITKEYYDSLDDQTKKLIDTKGYGGLMDKIKNQTDALKILDQFKTGGENQVNPVTGKKRFIKDSSYDVAKALRNGVSDETILNAFNDNQDILDKAKDYNMKNYGVGVPDDGENTPYISREDFIQNLATEKLGTTKLPDFKDPDYEKEMKKWNEAYDWASKEYLNKYGEKNVALSNVGAVAEQVLVPVARVIRPEVKFKDLTTLDWALTGLVVAAAAVPAIRGVSAGVRAGKSIGGAVGDVVISEAKAQITGGFQVLKDEPIKVGAWTDIGESAVRPNKVPIESLEIREMTVRVPVSETGLSGSEAKAIRDSATTKVITNKGETVINNTALELTPTALNRTSPAVVHATPDVRPFIEGATIETGREGGLFVSPTLHTRFTGASAFGDLPEDGIKGALIIRDEKVLTALKGSGKIYKGTTEIEKVIPPGVELNKPSQVLITRNMQGEKITLLVYGKPFNAAELAKMKILGAADTVKNIFTPTYKLSKDAESLTNKMVETSKNIKTLETELQQAKVVKNTNKIQQLEKDIEHSKAELRRYGDDLKTSYRSGRVDPVVVSTADRSLITERKAPKSQTRNVTTPSRVERTSTRTGIDPTSVRISDARSNNSDTRPDVNRTNTADTNRGEVIRADNPESRTDNPGIRTDNPPERSNPPDNRTPPTDVRSPSTTVRTPDPRMPITNNTTKTKIRLNGKSSDEPAKPDVEVKPGSLAWEQGALKIHGKLEPVIVVEEPGYTKKKILVGQEPKGYVDTGDTPKETIQTINGPVKKEVDVNLGLTTAHASPDKKEITFTANPKKIDLVGKWRELQKQKGAANHAAGSHASGKGPVGPKMKAPLDNSWGNPKSIKGVGLTRRKRTGRIQR